MPRLVSVLLAVVLGYGLALHPAHAQMFSYEPNRPGSSHSLSLGYYLVDMAYTGEGEPGTRFDFDHPAYALRYTRPNFDLSVAYGRQGAADAIGDEAQRFIEAGLFAWSGLLLNPRSETRLYLPLAIHSGYRAIGEDLGGNTAADLFNFTTLGLGTGLIIERRFGSVASIQARGLPVLGLALRSFEGYAGSSRLIDADVQIHLHRLFGRFGLSVSYGFRGQNWDVDAARFTQSLPEDWFDYRSRQHMMRFGFNW